MPADRDYSRPVIHLDAVNALRTAFEKGCRNFRHIENGDDMDPLRDLPEFEPLISEYEEKAETARRK